MARDLEMASEEVKVGHAELKDTESRMAQSMEVSRRNFAANEDANNAERWWLGCAGVSFMVGVILACATIAIWGINQRSGGATG